MIYTDFDFLTLISLGNRSPLNHKYIEFTCIFSSIGQISQRMLYFISLSAKYILSTRDLRGLVQCKSGTIRRFFNFFSILIVGIERPLPSSLNRRCSYKGSAKKLMSSRTLEDKKGVKVLQCSTNAISKIRRLKHIPTL